MPDKHGEFLKADFEQCHEWMRYYDGSFTSMINFLYAGYVAIITAGYVLYSSFPTSFMASMGATILLCLGSFLSPIFLYWLMKNRVYFTKVARWVNEIREAYLKHEPFGIKNKSKIYASHEYPRYFNYSSTHSVFLYFTAFCGSIFLVLTFSSALMTISIYSQKPFIYPFYSSVMIAVVFFATYMFWVVFYLRSKEVRK